VIPGNTSSQGKYADEPTSVSASPGDGQATVSFTLPEYDGKGVATYVVTASPGGATASGSTSPITVTGLSNGTSYTFTVTTVTGYGVSRGSGNSNAATPVAPPYFPPFFPPNFTPCPPAGSAATLATAQQYCTRSCGSNSGCDGGSCGYTCEGTYSYEYWCQGCPGYEGGYNQGLREGCCGYTSGGGGGGGGGGGTPPQETPACTSCNGVLSSYSDRYECVGGEYCLVRNYVWTAPYGNPDPCNGCPASQDAVVECYGNLGIC
jgi:hypothetical protein